MKRPVFMHFGFLLSILKEPCKAIIFFLSFLPIVSFAQFGSPDPTFNPLDPGFGRGMGAFSSNFEIDVQSNDRAIILVDDSFRYNNYPFNSLARIKSDGLIDSSFSAGSGFGTDDPEIIKVLSTDKIIVGGNFDSYQGHTAINLVRINTDGSIDLTFKSNGLPASNSTVTDILELPDGKILVTGIFSEYGGLYRKNIVRLNSDGTLDETFDAGTEFDTSVLKLALQSDGRVIVVGSHKGNNPSPSIQVGRLNSDGGLDQNFAVGSLGGIYVHDIEIQDDNKILIAGGFSEYNNLNIKNIVRLEADGSVDESFTLGQSTSGFIYDVELTADQQILLAGAFSNLPSKLNKFSAQGIHDPTFNTGIMDSADKILRLSSGKYLIKGITFYDNFPLGNLARINSDGTLDHEFNKSTGFNKNVAEVDSYDDGSLLVYGSFSLFNHTLVPGLVKLTASGVLDNSAELGSGFNNEVYDITRYPGNKMLVCGKFTEYNGQAAVGIVRLLADGSIDESFQVSGVSIIHAEEAVVQPDGKIVVAAGQRIYRLNPDGSVDPTFNQETIYDSNVVGISLFPNGKIAVAGYFMKVNGVSCPRVAKLNSDGTPDNTFNPGLGLSVYCPPGELCIEINFFVYDVLAQPNGKIIVGGSFGSYNGNAIYNIVRVNANGSYDATFKAMNPHAVYEIQTMPTGELLVLEGRWQNNFHLLNPDDGSKHTLYDQLNGFNGFVSTATFQPDGKIIVGGNFTNMNDLGRNGLLRINNHELSLANWEFDTKCSDQYAELLLFKRGTFNPDNEFHLELSDENGSFASPHPVSIIEFESGDSQRHKIPGGIPSGTYWFRLRSTSPAMTKEDDFPIEIIGVDTSVSVSGNSITALQEYATYEWLDCSNGYSVIANAFSPVFEMSSSGSFAVKVTYEGCTDTSRCVEPAIISAVQQHNSEALVGIAPNPASDKITLEGNIQHKWISLVDETGVEVYRSDVLTDSTYEINVQPFHTGIYLLRLMDDTGEETFKIIKE